SGQRMLTKKRISASDDWANRKRRPAQSFSWLLNCRHLRPVVILMFPEVWQGMSEQITVGEGIAAFLEKCGQKTAYGVISIHNMPILDAFGTRDKIRFVPARGEAGAVSMADAHARVTGGLGVAVTSTGTAAGNAAGT